MQCAAFFVHERPQVVWTWDLADRSLEFLRGVDVGYFEHIAETERPLLHTEGGQYAAAALRLAHGQALEALFAFIAAAVQAPHCVLGWMLAYTNEELRAVIHDLTGRNLNELAQAIMADTQWEKEKQETLAQKFGTMWSKWSTEFLDERAQTEYNAFKHGVRARLGGFGIAVGREQILGAPASQESMVSLGSSVFGSAYFTSERIDGRLHIYPRHTNRNWSGEGMADSLQLLAMSIQNVVSHLRIIEGDDPTQCPFATPVDVNAFNLPWTSSPGVRFSSLDLTVTKDDIQPWTKDEVVTSLNRRKDVESLHQEQ